MNTKIYKVKGMHCASCASIIESTLKKTKGVSLAEVNYGTEKVKVSFDNSKITPADLSKKIEPFGYTLDLLEDDPHVDHMSKSDNSDKLNIWPSIILAIIAIFMMGWDILSKYEIISEMSYTLEEFFHHLLPLLATYTLFVIGKLRE
jgi:cation transport ATPase